MILAIGVSIKIVLIIQDGKIPVPPIFNAITNLVPDQSFFSWNNVNTQSAPQVTEKTITARAYIVGNINTGQVYTQLNATKPLPVASMSKLITALTALDEYKLDTKITITPEEANVPADGSHLQAGETFTVGELMYPLLLDSSNVAAEALASSTDRPRFLTLMSGYAWEIGMPSSYFADPSGLDSQNRASAKDLFTLAQYLTKYRPDILAMTKMVQITTATTTDHGSHVFSSIHPFVNDPNFLGGKTGHTTAAGDTMLTMININGQPIAIVILGADSGSRESDTRLLMAKVSQLI